MKTMQRVGLLPEARRCIVMYSLLLFSSIATATALKAADGDAQDLHDFAEININQYFEPEEHLLLSETSEKRAKALAHYSLGLRYEANGQTNKAIESYLVVIENISNQPMLSRKTAYLLAQNGENERAQEILDKTLQENPDDPLSYIILSDYLMTYQADDPEAQKRSYSIIQDAVKRFPDEPGVYEHLVKLHLLNDERDKARELIKQAAARKNTKPYYWLRLGGVAVRAWPQFNRSGDESIRNLINSIYKKALSNAKENVKVIEAVGDYYHATSQFDDALGAYRKIVDAHPDRLDVLVKIASVHQAKGEMDRVADTLREILEVDPKNAEIHQQLGQLLLNQKKTNEAIPHLTRALELNQGSANDYVKLGQFLIREGKFEPAIEVLEHGAYLFSKAPVFPFLLSLPLGALERWEESIDQFKKVLELQNEDDPEMVNQDFYFRYAAAIERTGDIDTAAKHFRRSIELIEKYDPKLKNKQFAAQVYNYLGYMWLENDMNIEEAGELIKTALVLDPESGAITDSLGWFYFKTGKFKEAKTELLKAKSLTKNPDPVIYDHIAQAHYELGEIDEAVTYLKQAIEMDGENQEFLDRLKQYESTPAPTPTKEAPEKEKPEALKPAA